MRNKATRAGTTMIEVLVVLGITGLLVGLLLPGVQAAREAARANDCRHRMRQTALAAHGFHEAHGYLPSGYYARVGRPAFPRMLSAWAHLIPFLDQSSLYRQIDKDPNEDGVGAYPGPPVLTRPANQQLLTKPLSVVTCPSDSTPAGACNFRVCWGSASRVEFKINSRHWAGPWARNHPDEMATFAWITDGLSQTALVSERIIGDYNTNRFTPARDIYFFDPPPSRPSVYSPDEFASACQSQFRIPLLGEMSYVGATWLLSGPAYTMYNHVLPPNATIPDCTYSMPSMSQSAVTARSWHAQGVNVAFADGHVRCIANQSI